MWKAKSSSIRMPRPFLCFIWFVEPWYLPLRQSNMSVCIYNQILFAATRNPCPKIIHLPSFFHRIPLSAMGTYNLKMKDNYVSNIEEVLIANQTQKNKIQFLERQRVKREHYLDDLRENLHLNKTTLREMNDMGPNIDAISRLTEETQILIQKLRNYYEEYQNINAVLLMEKQMRLEDKQFYNQRMVEFENKMIDLRKYLHDKEDSFSSVVARLKRYEDLAETTLDQKLINYKKEIGERHVNQFISEILKEKSFYQREYENMNKNYFVFKELKKEIISAYPQVQAIIENYQTTNKLKLDQLFKGLANIRSIQQPQEKEKKQVKKLKVDPNKELIRLVKKQKLSKELYQDALNEAIEKNEELVSIKSIYEKTIQKLESKCALLYAENTIFALRLAEYDIHYSRYATHNKRYYEEGQTKGLRHITEMRLKQYAQAAKNFSNLEVNQRFEQRLKEEIQKWSQFMCQSNQLKRQLDKKGILIKSCSTPNLLFGYELDEIEATENLLIQQY